MSSSDQGPIRDRASKRRLARGRRSWLAATSLAAASIFGENKAQSLAQEPSAKQSTAPGSNGKIRQSVMGWCFNPMPVLARARLGKRLGLVAIEGVDRKYYPELRKLGLEISLVGSHGFAKGPVNTDYHAQVESQLRSAIDTAVEFNSPSVITFTGMQVPGMSEQQGRENCLACWKRIIEYAEEKEITLCLEHLNSRDDSHPMKGHPGYFGDDVDLCLDLVKAMDSPRFKLLFDIYHVQVMHGDVIRRLRAAHPWIGHYHTAGNPGRCEIDQTQELNYPPIMRAILETGYTGYVAQEFIPTWNDPAKSLEHAINVCNVA